MSENSWYHQNVDYLMQAIAQIKVLLHQHIARSQGEAAPGATVEFAVPPQPTPIMTPPSALEQVCTLFELSAFERAILVLCAGQAIMPDLPQLCAIAHNHADLNYPTFQLACQCFPDPHWNALSSHRPLRAWQLIHGASHPEYTRAQLQIDEAILDFLMGEAYRDPSLSGIIFPVSSAVVNPVSPLQASHQVISQQIQAVLQTPAATSVRIQLCGNQRPVQVAIAIDVATQLQIPLFRLPAEALPNHRAELERLGQRWRRWLRLRSSLLLLSIPAIEVTNGHNLLANIEAFIQSIDVPILLLTEQRLTLTDPHLITFDVAGLNYQEQLALWQAVWPNAPAEWAAVLGQLASQFRLSATMIQMASGAMQTQDLAAGGELRDRLWEFCRLQARPHLEALAQRIEVQATWDDLILPDRETHILHQITTHVRQQAQVYQNWGFAQKHKRGLGLTALFSGVSGTGKTTAAEILAQELKLDLFRIDLSAVMSKYIGETEKNLRRIFDAAEMGGVLLLFDEADALFGKRTQVKDSHDRHANIEVSYLLQRMEAYQGLAILTTNLKDNLDQAFLRRLRFVINFPYPKALERSQIWQRVFPPQTPTAGLDFALLGQLDITGGNIKAIALNAAFLAADAHEPVTMKHIFEATKTEYLKLGRSLTPNETRHWDVA